MVWIGTDDDIPEEVVEDDGTAGGRGFVNPLPTIGAISLMVVMEPEREF